MEVPMVVTAERLIDTIEAIGQVLFNPDGVAQIAERLNLNDDKRTLDMLFGKIRRELLKFNRAEVKDGVLTVIKPTSNSSGHPFITPIVSEMPQPRNRRKDPFADVDYCFGNRRRVNGL
jgi:hypothetical protein